MVNQFKKLKFIYCICIYLFFFFSFKYQSLQTYTFVHLPKYRETLKMTVVKEFIHTEKEKTDYEVSEKPEGKCDDIPQINMFFPETTYNNTK